MSQKTYFQKGFGLKPEIEGQLFDDYHSQVVERLKDTDYRLQIQDVTIRLAQEFGFCYGVDRAVDYAYETRKQFPDRKIYITGEIIHNSDVNGKLISMGVEFLDGIGTLEEKFEPVESEDVVIIPAFGVPVSELKILKDRGCVMVDTTCGSVLNVWKNVGRYAKEGFTSIIHGKYQHEETMATSSRASQYPGGKYLVVSDMDQTNITCDYILQKGDKADFLSQFERAYSHGFDPDRDLGKIGLANQTTMLSAESLKIADTLKEAMIQRYGKEELESRFRTFDTICSATQDRQDAVYSLVREGLDLMIVIGGYNSSNTNHLGEIASQHTSAYHIDDANCIIDRCRIRHKPTGEDSEKVSSDWMPDGKVTIGFTAGASTPNNKIGEAIQKVLECMGYQLEDIMKL